MTSAKNLGSMMDTIERGARSMTYGNVIRDANAVKRAEQGCLAGDLNLCVIRGWMADAENTGGGDPWYERSCAPGFLDGCHFRHRVKDMNSSVEWLRKGCDIAGDERSCALAARRFHETKQTNEAKEYFRKGCVDRSYTAHCEEASKYDPLFSAEELAEKTAQRKQREETKDKLRRMAYSLGKTMKEKGVRPVAPEGSDGNRWTKDLWGTEIALQPFAESDKLTSAGPDKAMGTGDDIIFWTEFRHVLPRWVDKVPKH